MILRPILGGDMWDIPFGSPFRLRLPSPLAHRPEQMSRTALADALMRAQCVSFPRTVASTLQRKIPVVQDREERIEARCLCADRTDCASTPGQPIVAVRDRGSAAGKLTVGDECCR
jgi:hypothetical protein